MNNMWELPPSALVSLAITVHLMLSLCSMIVGLWTAVLTQAGDAVLGKELHR